jgi:hypothetical protein
MPFPQESAGAFFAAPLNLEMFATLTATKKTRIRGTSPIAAGLAMSVSQT